MRGQVRFGFALAFLLASSIAVAGRINGDGGGGGGSSFLGGTLTSGLTFSAITTDITTGTNEDFVIAPNGTGDISLNSEVYNVNKQDGTNRGAITPDASTANTFTLTSGAAGGGSLRLTASGYGAMLASKGDISATNAAATVSDGTSATADGNALVYFMGEGMVNIVKKHSIAESAATLNTTTPTSSVVEFNCTSGTVCNYEPGETSAATGKFFTLVNIGTSGIVVTDAAGKVVVRGSPLTIAADQSMYCMYANTLWHCQ